MRTRQDLLTAIVLTSTVLAAPGRAVAGVQCGQTKSTRVEVSVHSTPPQFSTASGWALGPTIAKLPLGATLQVCDSSEIGFPGGRKVWLRIEFDLSGQPSEGWIYGVGTLLSAGPVRPPVHAGLLSFFTPEVAYAQGPESGVAPDDGLPGTPSRWPFYAWAFSAICLGMMAKSAFDWVQQAGGIVARDLLLRSVPALLVSPMVFLSLSQLANVQFAADGQAFIVSLCTAFQSGFFWQTVLVRTASQGAQSTVGLVPAVRATAVSPALGNLGHG
jgi:hypothetical protein